MAPFFSFRAYVYRGQGQPLRRSLEQVAQSMESLPGLFFEWDGSLTWANQLEGWQIDATIFDNRQSVQYIDLHGRAISREGCELMNERIADLFAAWEESGELQMMRLPDRRWQNLQQFAKESLASK